MMNGREGFFLVKVSKEAKRSIFEDASSASSSSSVRGERYHRLELSDPSRSRGDIKSSKSRFLFFSFFSLLYKTCIRK